MIKVIVILAVLIVVALAATVMVVLWPSEDMLQRRARRRSVVIEDALVDQAAENYDLLRRFNGFVEHLLTEDVNFPIFREAQRDTARRLVDEFTGDKKG